MGFDLDQTFAPGFPCTFCCMFLSWTLLFCLCFSSSMFSAFDLFFKQAHLHPGTRNINHYHSVDCVHIIWSRCCVCMVRIGTMGLFSTSRAEMAQRYLIRSQRKVPPASRHGLALGGYESLPCESPQFEQGDYRLGFSSTGACQILSHFIMGRGRFGGQRPTDYLTSCV